MRIRKWHKYLSIAFVLPLFFITVTGVLLTLRTQFSWMTPKKVSITPTDSAKSVLEVIDRVGAEKISSIIYSPGNHVYTIRTKDYKEIQLNAETLEKLYEGERYTSLIIRLHEGSFFGKWVRETIVMLTGLILVFLCFSGVYMWLTPLLRKRSKRKKFI